MIPSLHVFRLKFVWISRLPMRATYTVHRIILCFLTQKIRWRLQMMKLSCYLRSLRSKYILGTLLSSILNLYATSRQEIHIHTKQLVKSNKLIHAYTNIFTFMWYRKLSLLCDYTLSSRSKQAFFSPHKGASMQQHRLRQCHRNKHTHAPSLSD